MGKAAIALAVIAGLIAVGATARATRDGAVIVDSGSTNSMGYRIDVWSDGSAQSVLHSRGSAAHGSPKAFSLSPSLATRFFADLKAARDGNALGTPCMKSASFGTSTHVTWHGWISPDLDCPAGNSLTAALVSDVNAIRSASGVQTMLLRHFLPGPPHVEVSPAST